MINASLFARGRGLCVGTLFSGCLLGRSQEFPYSGHAARIALPSAEFAEGSAEPTGANANVVSFRNGWANDPRPEVSYYQLEYVNVEIDVPKRVKIPKELLRHPAVRKSPEADKAAPHLEKLTNDCDDLLAGALRHWMKVARWATDQHAIGVTDWEVDGAPDLKMARLYEKQSGFGIWASTVVTQFKRAAEIDEKKWDHIGRVLVAGHTPPIWFEYLVEASHRLADQDYSGSVLSSAIACETMARAAFSHLAGNPPNAAAGDLIDRIAAQAIIGRWEKLTGIKAAGAVHKLFETRNGLVHSGRTGSVDKSKATTSFEAARKFVENGDEWWFAEKGLNNPRTSDSA